jgi:hypothetical protein
MDGDWIHLARDTEQWRALMDTAVFVDLGEYPTLRRNFASIFRIKEQAELPTCFTLHVVEPRHCPVQSRSCAVSTAP